MDKQTIRGLPSSLEEADQVVEDALRLLPKTLEKPITRECLQAEVPTVIRPGEDPRAVPPEVEHRGSPEPAPGEGASESSASGAGPRAPAPAVKYELGTAKCSPIN